MRTHALHVTAALLLAASLLMPASAFAAPPLYITQWGTVGSGSGQFNAPFDVKVGSGGNVYVADAANDRVEEFGQFATPTRSSTWGGLKALYR